MDGYGIRYSVLYDVFVVVEGMFVCEICAHHTAVCVCVSSVDGHLQQIDDDGDAQEDAVRHATLVRRVASLRVACEKANGWLVD